VPFDSSRAKGFVYQTGVWVPLIVSGPLVVSPNREVTSMVNITDVFQLFGEIAGIDVHKVVPKSHILDSQSMLPYLTNPNQPSIRTTNFTQAGNNFHVTTPAPCVIPLTDPPTCIQLFNSKPLCNFEGGLWYGANPDGGTPYPSCCAVKRALYDPNNLSLQIYPVAQDATRNDNFKLVRKQVEVCAAAPSMDDKVQTQNEFYQINENVPIPAIDKDGTALCEGTACPTGLTSDETTIYNQLTSSMNATLTSEPPCPGDGNEDKVVNGQDIQNWKFFSTHGIPVEGKPPNTSSWYDFNHDGSTDNKDLQLILQNLGTHCLKADLFLRIFPSTTTVHQGDLLTYAFPVWNLGPSNADHEVLNTQVPAGTTFDYIRISGTPGLGTCTHPPYQGTGQIICHEGDGMAPNTTWTVRLTVKVTAPAGTVITANAATMAGTPDPKLANNVATVSIKVQ
jgi:hypothetical protein